MVGLKKYLVGDFLTLRVRDLQHRSHAPAPTSTFATRSLISSSMAIRSSLDLEIHARAHPKILLPFFGSSYGQYAFGVAAIVFVVAFAFGCYAFRVAQAQNYRLTRSVLLTSTLFVLTTIGGSVGLSYSFRLTTIRVFGIFQPLILVASVWLYMQWAGVDYHYNTYLVQLQSARDAVHNEIHSRKRAQRLHEQKISALEQAINSITHSVKHFSVISNAIGGRTAADLRAMSDEELDAMCVAYDEFLGMHWLRQSFFVLIDFFRGRHSASDYSLAAAAAFITGLLIGQAFTLRAMGVFAGNDSQFGKLSHSESAFFLSQCHAVLILALFNIIKYRNTLTIGPFNLVALVVLVSYTSSTLYSIQQSPVCTAPSSLSSN